MGLCMFRSIMTATYMAISTWLPICDSVYSWPLYSAAPLENQATSSSIMNQYIHLSHLILILACLFTHRQSVLYMGH